MGKKGNLGDIVIGAEPYQGDNRSNDLSLHIEAFYKYQLNAYISITPGLIWITSPNQNSNNQDAIIGIARMEEQAQVSAPRLSCSQKYKYSVSSDIGII